MVTSASQPTGDGSAATVHVKSSVSDGSVCYGMTTLEADFDLTSVTQASYSITIPGISDITFTATLAYSTDTADSSSNANRGKPNQLLIHTTLSPCDIIGLRVQNKTNSADAADAQQQTGLPSLPDLSDMSPIIDGFQAVGDVVDFVKGVGSALPSPSSSDISLPTLDSSSIQEIANNLPSLPSVSQPSDDKPSLSLPRLFQSEQQRP